MGLPTVVRSMVGLEDSDVILLANLQWKVAFDICYTNKFLIRICSRTHYQFLECTKVLYEIVSR